MGYESQHGLVGGLCFKILHKAVVKVPDRLVLKGRLDGGQGKGWDRSNGVYVLGGGKERARKGTEKNK